MSSNPSETRPSDSTLDAVGSQVSGAAARAKDKAADLGQSAVEKVDDQRGAAAGGLESAASALRSRADQLPGGPSVSGFAHSAADRLDSTADYVRHSDLNAMVADLGQIVKKNPGPSLLAAAFVGYLVGRALTSHD